jgi:uncharacterized protein (DUF58 family)
VVIPALPLVLLTLVPLALSLLVVFEPALTRVVLVADAAWALVAALDAVLGRRALVSVVREPPEVFSVGRANAVRLRIRSRSRRALTVQVMDDVPPDVTAIGLPATVQLPPGGRADLTYHVRPSRRGSYRLGDHTVRYPTPLGLWQRQLRLPGADAVKVYPDLKAVRTFELLARQNREASWLRAVRLRGGESEFERLREYRKDDEYRTIDWKATARRQRLTAREYQQERNQSILCLVDCGRLMTAESGGLTHLDHALNAALMMSHVAVRSGDQVGLLAFDAEVRAYLPPSSGRRATRRLVQSTYDLHPRLVEPDFAAAGAFLARRMRRRALVVLFTQVIDDTAARTVLRLMHGLGPRHLPLCVLFREVAVEALLHGAPDRGTDDLYRRGAAAEIVLWRERLVRDLRAAGALVLHTAAATLTPALVNQYLRIKAQQML